MSNQQQLPPPAEEPTMAEMYHAQEMHKFIQIMLQASRNESQIVWTDKDSPEILYFWEDEQFVFSRPAIERLFAPYDVIVEEMDDEDVLQASQIV